MFADMYVYAPHACERQDIIFLQNWNWYMGAGSQNQVL